VSEITLRDAVADDAPTIFTVMQAAFEQYRGVLVPPSGVHRETLATVIEKMAAGRYIVALRNDRVVGVVYYELRPDRMYLGRLAVLPEARGRGIARALVAAVEARALAAGRTQVELGVRAALPELRASYERMGYRLLEERSHPGFTVITYVQLVKDLAPADQQRPNEDQP
jgi:ribosomal protein S18 acetylase RimI-like enzyme